MNTSDFDPKKPPIKLAVEATGSTRSIVLELVLDTGATVSLIDLRRLLSMGFDPSQSVGRA